jgi:hypothetical protein
VISYSEQRYFQKDIIDYLDYVFPNPSQEALSQYVIQILNKRMMTYNDAHLISESDYFTKQRSLYIEGYKTIRRDRIDTEELRQSYFLKSSQIGVRTFF